VIVPATRFVRSDLCSATPQGARQPHARMPVVARWVLGLVLAAAASGQADAATYYVDTNNPNANDLGPGSAAVPYRTIDRAVSVRGGPNVTIEVRAGRYPEQVTVTKSGTLAEPFVIKAVTHPVVIDGGENFSFAALWAPAGGTAFRTGLSDQPSMVIVDGVRLAGTAAAPAAMPSGTYRWVAGDGLYVNLGGTNPGTHSTYVSTRLYGLRITSASHVRVEGIQITRVGTHGIYFPSNGTNVTLLGNQTSWNGVHGIAVVAATNLFLEGNEVHHNASHGISVIDATGNLLQENSIHDNGTPTALAVGLRLFNSSNNVLRRNRTHHNNDSGVEISGGSNNNILVLNLSYRNGDHGFGHLESTGNVLNSNVAWDNVRDGISVEGGSTGTQVWNTIMVENGVDSSRFCLFVDSTSTPGFVSNYNLIWNPTSQNPVKYANVQYASLAAFSGATGHDFASFQSDPRFASPMTGDFRLQSGSKAIDSGHSGTPHWQADDFVKHVRVDDAPTPNDGAGPVLFADRGVYEFVRSGSVGVEDLAAGVMSLSAPRPNPARGGVALALDLKEDAYVSWEIMDVQGRVIWREHAVYRAAGRTVLNWPGVDASGALAAPGLYLARISTGRATLARRIVVIK